MHSAAICSAERCCALLTRYLYASGALRARYVLSLTSSSMHRECIFSAEILFKTMNFMMPGHIASSSKR